MDIMLCIMIKPLQKYIIDHNVCCGLYITFAAKSIVVAAFFALAFQIYYMY